MVITPSDEVLFLRDRVKALEGELSCLQQSYNRVELLYRSETLINIELQDLLSAHGIPYRDAIKEYTALNR